MTENIKLRHMFVSMLFALVIGQLALESYDVFKNFRWGLDWFEPSINPVLHLLVALFLITTSWVGWSKTFDDPDYPSITGLCSKGYVLLLIDVVILIVYFSLVKSVDPLNVASGIPEAILVMLVFILYFVWDFIYSNKEISSIMLDVWPSGLSALLCFFVFKMFSEEQDLIWLTDLCLIAIIFAFRGMKYLQLKN